MQTPPTTTRKQATRRLARWAGPAVALAFAGLTMVGCSKFEQVQYFEVVGPPDPITGLTSRSYYRMTVTGRGTGVEEYKMRAAYLSSAALDTLDGKIPTIPAADMDENRRQYFRSIRAAYLRTAQARAEELANRYEGDAMDPQQFDQVMTEISRAVWAVTLSDSDLASLGQVRSVDPFEFRKLVFYASARAVALDRYNAQVDSAIQKTNALANLFDRSRVQRETTANEELLEKARAVHQAGQEIQRIETEKKQAEDDRAAILAQMEPYETSLRAVQVAVESETTAKSALEAQLLALQASLADEADEDNQASLNQQISGTELRIETLKNTLKALGDRATYLEGEISRLNDEADALTTRIQGYQSNLQGLTTSLQRAVEELNEVAQSTASPADAANTNDGNGGNEGDGGTDGGDSNTETP